MNWAQTLNPAQRRAVTAIREHFNGGVLLRGTDGWTVFMTPTTREPTYLELRHRLTGGGVARWVIERDGSVSAHNDLGRLRSCVSTEGFE